MKKAKIIVGICIATLGILYPTQVVLGGPPTLTYYPTTHDFGEKNQGESDYTRFLIWTEGTCSDDMLVYSLTTECTWITVTPTNGTCTCGEIDTIQVRIDTTSLSSGSHNCSILIHSNGGTGTFRIQVYICNSRPEKPVMSGKRIGQTGTNYTYTCTSWDPEGDDIHYNFSWGDGTYSGWLGPFSSGKPASKPHRWTTGIYTVQAKARDENGAESNWSDPLTIVMPMNIPRFTRGLLDVLYHWRTATQKNWGETTFHWR